MVQVSAFATSPLSREEVVQDEPNSVRTSRTRRRANPTPQPRPSSLQFTTESAHETAMRLSNEFPALMENDYDTLVFIGCPDQVDSQSDTEYEQIQSQFKRPYLLKSSTLRALGSSQINALFGPVSARTERRLKKQNVHRSIQTQNIKYYIDLSPALNDDEALIQLTQLSVPRSALEWHQRAVGLPIPNHHVCGRDDLSFVPILTFKPDPAKASEGHGDADSGTATEVSEEETASPAQRPYDEAKQPALSASSLPIEDEYSSLRHHTALARLLYAATGQNPRLNSAAKMWTYCMIAKYFGCASNPNINHWIMSWLLESANCHFIQHLPDVSYLVAFATESQWLMRCAFTILVGQQAFTSNAPTLTGTGQYTKPEPHVAKVLDDDEINRIDHAAAALTRKVKKTLEELVVYPGLWTCESGSNSELYKLRTCSVDDAVGQTALEKIREMLKHYLQRMIFMTLSHQYDYSLHRSIPPFPGFRQYKTYIEVPRPQRILTQQFWHIIRLEDLGRDYADTFKNKEIWDATEKSLRQEGVITCESIPYVSRKELSEAIADFNRLLVTKRNSSAESDSGQPAKRLRTSGGDSQDNLTAQTSHPETRTLPVRSAGVVANFRNKDKSTSGRDLDPPVTKSQASVSFASSSQEKQDPMPMSTTSRFAQLSVIDDALSDTTNDLLVFDSDDAEDRISQNRNVTFDGDSDAQSLLSHHGSTTSPANDRLVPPTQGYRGLLPQSYIAVSHALKSSIRRAAADSSEIECRALLEELQDHLYTQLEVIVNPGYVLDGTCDIDIPTGNVSTLLCLDEEEYKYLPMWAGGLDDGSGGVFTDGVEPLDAPEVNEGGFRGGAIGIIPGVGSVTDPSASGAGSEFEDIATDMGVSTVGKASRWATDGTATETVISMED